MPDPNFENRTLFHGDNLEFLRGMNTGTVHLIATDPPFNKGRDFHATPDSLAAGARFQDRWSWDDDVHPEWVDQITDDWPDVMNVINGSRQSYGDDMGAFLCFMGVRLLEMRRVLRDDGSIYLHCDPTASHYLKELMDAIFGKRNFRNEIVWNRTLPKGLMTRRLPTSHDLILSYQKSRTAIWNNDEIFTPYDEDNLDEKTESQYSRKDENGRRYQLTSLLNPNADRPNLTYEFMGVTRVWRWTRERMQEEYENGRIVQTAAGRAPRFKRYLDEQRGRPLSDVWTDIPPVSGNEDTDYPTQKPTALYERIIRMASNRGHWVLDPFAGCATTCIVAERLGRQWVGIDIWDRAHQTVIDRLQKEGLAAPDGDTGGRLLSFGEIGYSTEPPVRTDDGGEAVPFLRAKVQRAVEPWQRLSRTQIVERLEEAQAQKDMVICGGCGRTLEPAFMELDHIVPRADGGPNDITNRILLCPPCNKRKSARYTLSGLRAENKKAGWMRDEDLAKIAQHNARAMADRVHNEMVG